MLTLATAALLLPAAFAYGVENTDRNNTGILVISRGTAIVLFLVYIAYLVFVRPLAPAASADSSQQLKSHAYLFEAEQDTEEEEPEMGMYFSIGALLGITVVTSFCADCACAQAALG